MLYSRLANKISLALIVMFAIFLTWLWTPPSYDDHFEQLLPESAELLLYERQQAGFDVNYAFAFSVADDSLLNQLIDEWNLKPVPDRDFPLSAWTSLDPPRGWPSKETLSTIKSQYTWEGHEEYKSVWFDPASKRLYAEKGRW